MSHSSILKCLVSNVQRKWKETISATKPKLDLVRAMEVIYKIGSTTKQ